jgi:hypothetical protein
MGCNIACWARHELVYLMKIAGCWRDLFSSSNILWSFDWKNIIVQNLRSLQVIELNEFLKHDAALPMMQHSFLCLSQKTYFPADRLRVSLQKWQIAGTIWKFLRVQNLIFSSETPRPNEVKSTNYHVITTTIIPLQYW